MSGTLRSKQGCWSCRLRKKKCDERQPQCSTCESLSITCHGYGPKPAWMDNGEKERAVIEEFKHTTRRTVRPKHQPQPAVRRNDRRQQHRQPVVIAMRPAATNSAVSNSNSNSGSAGTQTVSHLSTPSDAPVHHPQNQLLSSREEIPSSEEGPSDGEFCSWRDISIAAITPRDSMPLMHYLDYIVPAQYPFYHPQPLDGGRGWLLSLLCRTKPLRHVALALSSYHRLIATLGVARPACQVLAMAHHQQHLESCLKEVQRTMREVTQMKPSSPDFEVGTVISVIQLVFSEVFTGEAGDWRMHLRGAIEMYRSAMKDEKRHASRTVEALAILRSGIPLEGEPATLCEDVSTLRFMSSAVLWLDTLGSITEGTEPRLLSMHDMDLRTGSGVRLEEVVGCASTVVAQIARIAALQAGKNPTTRPGRFPDCESFTREAADIRDTLCQADQQVMTQVQEAHELRPKAGETISKVTQFFSYAARVYLHLTITGFRECNALQETTSQAMTYLRTEITTDLVPGLVCPLFIVGCAVETHCDQELLRNTFSSHQFLDPLFKHRTKLLSILEEVWNERWREGYSWDNVVQLSHEFLLI